MTRLWPFVFFTIIMLAACHPVRSDTDRVEDAEALGAVMATGLTEVALHGPQFSCADNAIQQQSGFESRSHGSHHHGPRRQSGLFFKATQGATASYIGREVRGVVCYGVDRPARVRVFTPEPPAR